LIPRNEISQFVSFGNGRNSVHHRSCGSLDKGQKNSL
jgi:hypothetical protein